MANPSDVACTADTWTAVATNVTTGDVKVLTTKPQYRITFRDAGDPAPTAIGDGRELNDNIEVRSSVSIDVYVYAENVNGSVRWLGGSVVIGDGGVTGAAGGGGYTSGTDSFRVEEINPLSEQYVPTTRVSTTNLVAASGPFYYPDADGAVNGGIKDITASGKIDDANGTMTLTLEMTNDPDRSAGDWKQVYFYDDGANATVNQLQVVSSSLIYALSANNVNFCYWRWKITVTTDDNAVKIFERVKAL
jgi:hypothetical protein